MNVFENKESLRWHLIGFSNMYEYKLKEEPNYPVGKMADDYLDNEIKMEQGMKEYHDFISETKRYNERILKAVKSVKGKAFYKNILIFIEDRQPCDYSRFEIVKEPTGEEQSLSEYGRSIKKEWVEQWSVGDSGDSWNGNICVELKPNKYLKFAYSM